MSEVHTRSSLFLNCVFLAAASSVTVAATTPILETTTHRDKCQWSQKHENETRDKTDESCYLFISEGMSFHEANESCVDEGAHLVYIGNNSENALVVKLKQMAEIWIGLYRLTNESCARRSCTTWMWLDGSDPGYYNWRVGRTGTTVQCVFMNTAGTWEHTQLCISNLSFVCEKSIPPSITTPELTSLAVTSEMPGTSLSNSASTGVPDSEKNTYRTEDKMPIIIGCVVGGLALVAIVTVVAVVLLKRHRTSRPIDQPVEVKDEETPKVDKPVRYNPAYEDVEPNVTFKPSPGNTDTGAPGNTDTGTPGNTDTGAYGVGDNPHNIYSKARKKEDRPGSEGILVKENTLYGYGK